jgi:glucokinase
VKRVLAVDFGGTKTAVARVGEDGTIGDRHSLPAAHDLDGSVAQVAEAYSGEAAVGLIVPGIYTSETGRAWCPNLWGAGEVPLLDRLRSRVKAPVFVDNDRAGYVLGEAWLGAARGIRHVIYVSVGTGIGAGILSDGLVLRGAHGIAGAAGWFALDPDWREEYRLTGCWEAEAAGPALARRAGAADAAAVVAAARAGEPTALDALEAAASFTAMGVANLISALNPEMVVLGGGIVQGAGDLLVDRVRAGIARWAQPVAAARCRIVLTQLGEAAGLLGAARLALDRI